MWVISPASRKTGKEAVVAGDRFAVGMVDHKGKTWKFTGDWAAGITSGGVDGLVGSTEAVSYTHLTLPTICSV